MRKPRASRRRKVNEPPQIFKDVLSFIESKRTDDITDYAARGRPLAGLSTDDLQNLWVSTIRGLIRNPSDADLLKSLGDADAEYAVRHEQPPNDIGEAEITAWIETIEILGARIRADLEEYKHRRRRGN